VTTISTASYHHHHHLHHHHHHYCYHLHHHQVSEVMETAHFKRYYANAPVGQLLTEIADYKFQYVGTQPHTHTHTAAPMGYCVSRDG